jgi:hypothetical protein
MYSSLSLLALGLASTVGAQSPGSIVEAGDTLVSAMMVSAPFRHAPLLTPYRAPLQMFLGNEQKVYILDKAEGNSQQINGHPAWGSVW